MSETAPRGAVWAGMGWRVVFEAPLLRLVGEFDVSSVTALTAGVAWALNGALETLHVDLGAVAFLDIVGADPLFHAARSCAAYGGALVVTDCSDAARSALVLFTGVCHTPPLLESRG